VRDSRALLLAAVLLAALSACSAERPPSPTSPSTPGLRGEAIAGAACPGPGLLAEPTEDVVPVREVSSLELCGSSGADGGSGRVLRSGQPGFVAAVAALARPNEAAAGGACRAYQDLRMLRILAGTPGGRYWLEVPHDACGHYVVDDSSVDTAFSTAGS
jgi:hypothetical protein